MARREPPYLPDGHQLQEMAQRTQTPSAQSGHLGKESSEGHAMVSEPTGYCLENDPTSERSDEPGTSQAEELHYGWAGHQGRDGGADSELVTSFMSEIQRLKCQSTFEGSQRCAFVYSELSPADSVYTLCMYSTFFYGCLMIQRLLTGQYLLLHPSGNSKLWALRNILPSIISVCFVDRLVFSSFVFRDDQAVYIRCSHIQNFQPKFYIGSTSSFVLDREQSRYRNRANLFWPKPPYAFGTDLATFGCGPSSRCTPANPTFGPWNRP